MRVPRSRQVDALRETVHLGSARAAAALARLLSDAPVLIEVPRVVATGPPGLGWLLGGRDARVVAATFDVGGDVSAELWWVLPAEAARRLGQRLLQRTSGCGVVAASEGAALAEAANIVASSCCSAMGTMLGARMVPSTPRLQEADVEGLVTAPAPPRLAVFADFASTAAPAVSGTLVVLLAPEVAELVFERLLLASR